MTKITDEFSLGIKLFFIVLVTPWTSVNVVLKENESILIENIQERKGNQFKWNTITIYIRKKLDFKLWKWLNYGSIKNNWFSKNNFLKCFQTNN